jgi:hypothetical protein
MRPPACHGSGWSDNPEGTRRFLGVMAGTVSIAAFFAPENLGAITGMAA